MKRIGLLLLLFQVSNWWRKAVFRYTLLVLKREV